MGFLKLAQSETNAGSYLAKVGVEGSNPFARSILGQRPRHGEVANADPAVGHFA